MAHVDPADDLPHAPPGVPGWTENYQWCGTAPSGVGFMLHIGTMRDAPHLWHTVSAIVLADGAVFVSKTVGPAPAASSAGTGLSAVDTLVPLERWRWQADCGMRAVAPEALEAALLSDGPSVAVRVDIDLVAASPVWEPTGSEEHPEWGRFHHEQALRFEGTVVVDGVEHALAGVGHRDHSTGVRDLRELERAFWCNGTFPSGRSFATMWARRGNGVEFDRAAVHAAGVWTDVGVRDIPTVLDSAANPRTTSFVLDGDVVEVEVLGGVPFSVAGETEWCIGTQPQWPRCYLLTHRLARVQWRGETGSGFLDRGATIGLLGSVQP